MFHLEFVFTAKPKWRLLRNGPESSAHMSKQSTLRLGWSTPVAKLLIVEATKNAHRYITCGSMVVITPIRHVQQKRMKYLCRFNLSNTSPAVKPPVVINILDRLFWAYWSKDIHTVWTVNDVSVNPHTFLFWVNPYPSYCIDRLKQKRVWINSNKKAYGSTETSLTVHTVCK